MNSKRLWLGLALCCAALGCQNTDLNSGPTLINDTPAQPVDPCPPPETMPIIINELMLLNDSTVMGPEGFQPWIELYNPTTEPFVLGGVELSSLTGFWELPCEVEEVIEPGEYLVLFFSDAVPDPKLPGDLTIDFLPETVGPITIVLSGLTDDFGVSFNASDLGPDESIGLSPDGDPTAPFEILKTPTPGTMNSEPVPPPPVFVRGDVDANGVVDSTDLTLLNQIVFEGTAPLPACADRVDVNDDGVIDLGDPSFFVLALEAGGPTIPAPFPDPAEDLTPDDLPCENEVIP